ncbi:MAG: ArsC family reductase [Gammaproteobacteria bacterium]|jgi:Spx/MgsR family transcriptional regulator
MSTILYGISNCDKVRKARRWLDAHDVEYRFHDVRKDGLERKTLRTWIAKLGWENLLNRRGTTWRALPEAVRAGINAAAAEHIMLEHPASIKRPLLEYDGDLFPGFSESQYSALFGHTEKA